MRNAPGLAGGGGVGRQTEGNSPDSLSWPRSQQALHTIEGEQRARTYLERLRAGCVDPDELAATIATLRDAVSLAGFARVIEKALGGRHE